MPTFLNSLLLQPSKRVGSAPVFRTGSNVLEKIESGHVDFAYFWYKQITASIAQLLSHCLWKQASYGQFSFLYAVKLQTEFSILK